MVFASPMGLRSTAMFTGRHDLTLDPKNRLSVPIDVRVELHPETHGTRFYVVPGFRKNTLCLFPELFFRAHAREYLTRLMEPEDQLDFEDFVLGRSELAEIDKQGRMVVPDHLLRMAGIGTALTLTGGGDHLVLWSREDYENRVSSAGQRGPEVWTAVRRKGQSAGPATAATATV